MLTDDDKTAILAWTDQFFANATKCLTDNVCMGKSDPKLEAHIARVLVLKQNIEIAGDYLTDLQIDNLYRRLQCLINLKIED